MYVYGPKRRKSYIPWAMKYVGYTLRALARKVYPTYFKTQGISIHAC